MASVEDLERRVGALEARMHASEVNVVTVNAKLDAVIGGQDAMLGTLRDHGRALGAQAATLDEHGAKLDLIVDWIQSQP